MIAEPRGVVGKVWRLEVGPDYRRPAVDTPEAFRGRIGPDDAASIADVPWWDVFGDAVLRRLVTQSLAGNYDLQAAVARIEQARAQVGIAASDLYPQIGYQGCGTQQRLRDPVAPRRDVQFVPRRVQRVVGDRRVGAHPPLHRDDPGTVPRHRRGASRRRREPRERRRRELLPIARTRSRARDHARERGHLPAHARRVHAAVPRLVSILLAGEAPHIDEPLDLYLAAHLLVIGYGAGGTPERLDYPFERKIDDLRLRGHPTGDVVWRALVYRPEAWNEEIERAASWYAERGFGVVRYGDGDLGTVAQAAIADILK